MEKNYYIFLAFYIVLVLQPKFLTKEQRVAEALKKRQEMADLQRQKMDEERKKQIEFMKASKESMSMTVLSNFTSVFVYSRMWLYARVNHWLDLCFYCFYGCFQLLCVCVAFVFVFFVLLQIWFCWAMYVSTWRL